VCTATCQLVKPNPNGALCFCRYAFFVWQYCNIEALVKELGIPSPFTPFTRSSMWTPDGLQVTLLSSQADHVAWPHMLGGKAENSLVLSSMVATTCNRPTC